MAIIIQNDSEKFAVIGAGSRPGNFGASEEPFIVACNSEGKITLFTDFADNIEVVEINGKPPKEVLK